MKIPNLKKIYKYVITHSSILDKAQIEYAKKNYLKSIEYCNILSDHPNDFFGHYYRGLNFIELGLMEDARQSFVTALQKLQHNRFQGIVADYYPEVNFRISLTYYKERKYKEALEFITDTIKKYPRYISGYTFKAQIFEALNETLSAVDAINEGLMTSENDEKLIEYKNYLVYKYNEEEKFTYK